MMDCWVAQRPHLKGLADKVRALFTMADEVYQQGRANGDAVDYAAFEERVSQATAELECAVHQTVLGSLDIDVPFVRVWGKSYRRVHRTERSYGTMAGSVPVTRTLYRELGKRNGPVLDPIAMRAGMVDASWCGAVEATCKSLVAQRMKRPGSRWKPVTGNEMLQLRALQLSDRWEPAMKRVLRPLRKPVHVLTREQALGRAA